MDLWIDDSEEFSCDIGDVSGRLTNRIEKRKI